MLIISMQALQCITTLMKMFNWFRKRIATTTLDLLTTTFSGCFFSRKCFWKIHIRYYVIYLFFLDSFKTTSVADNDNANYKQCNSTQTKSNKSESLMHAIIGLAIMALLIIFIYLYTYQLKNYQIRSATV